MNRYLVLDLDKKKDALFFGDKFLSEAKGWNKEIRDIDAELEEVCELPAVTSSEVHSTNIGDPTEKIAFSVMVIRAKKARIETYKEILDRGLKSLNEEQKKVIDAFYFRIGKPINWLVSDLCNEFDCSPRKIYRIKESAILDFVSVVKELISE